MYVHNKVGQHDRNVCRTLTVLVPTTVLSFKYHGRCASKRRRTFTCPNEVVGQAADYCTTLEIREGFHIRQILITFYI